MLPTFTEYVQVHPRRFAVISLTIFAFGSVLLVMYCITPKIRTYTVKYDPQPSSVLAEEDIQKQITILQSETSTPPPTEEDLQAQLQALTPTENAPPTEEDIQAQLVQLIQQ